MQNRIVVDGHMRLIVTLLNELTGEARPRPQHAAANWIDFLIEANGTRNIGRHQPAGPRRA